uniref:Neural cell adhesion molecule L1-like protein n=1 Tax=Electrophorus electricus TaxID=8005 RepID=A0A4W4F3B0_ELEEL
MGAFCSALVLEQLPTIIAQPPRSLVALPFEDSFTLMCEAKGNPIPVFWWTKDGQDFNPYRESSLIKYNNSGSFVIPNTKDLAKYQGRYRCYASNKLGTAISEEADFTVPSAPKFPKEKIEPIVVNEGDSVVLECNPPKGIPPFQLYWMTIGLQHIEQNERVSMGLNGNLYFSNTVQKDSRRDYCCFASFPRIRTIVQKNAVPVVVIPCMCSCLGRKPNFLVPSGDHSQTYLVKDEELELECISEGLPTPTIEWTKVGEKLPKRTNIKNYGKLLTISKVKEEDSGKYACKAKNSFGEAVHHFHVAVEEPPHWVKEPTRSQVVTIGSDVRIECRAGGRPQPVLTWRKNGQPFHSDGNTISLHRAQPNDTAVYQCEASNRHGSLLATANIMVMNYPPLILTQDYLEYATVRGKSVTMDCQVFSSPPANINWKKEDPEGLLEGERFSFSQNGSLQIHTSAMEDIGKYVCFVTNSEGTSTISAELYIKDPTRITTPPQDLKIKRGSTAELVCQAEYDQSLSRELEILWQKDGREIYFNYTDDSGYYNDEGILQIINVSHSDKGLYTCIAKTPLDQDSASARLTVLDVPDSSVQLTLSDQRDRSVRLQWVSPRDHNSPITEYIIEYEESHWEPGTWRVLLRVSGNQNSAPLSLYGHIDYQFRITAVNSIGTGPPSKPSERYKTPPAAPDRNPENVEIKGHLPHQMDITWEPLMPIEHNGPGLEYQLSYRQLGVEQSWSEQIMKRHSFVVKDTPTFVPYEVKIQARNQHGWAPEPRVLIGYSGEDLPLLAPEHVSADILNSTAVRVSWSPVPPSRLRGRLGGYSVHWWRTLSLLTSKEVPAEKKLLTLSGNRSLAVVPELKPFTEYRLTVSVFNGRGSGPSSRPLTFRTPQGVPGKPPILRATNPQGDSITLVWAPPLEANGILTGYRLHYQIINNTMNVDGLYTVNIDGPDTTQWVLHDLTKDSQYKFSLSACTLAGCGPAVSEDGGTALVSRDSVGFWLFILLSLICRAACQSRCLCSARGKQSFSEIRVTLFSVCDGIRKISEDINTSRIFHIIEGLKPAYVDNSSLFEEVFQTKGEDERAENLMSSRSWIVGIMCALALLTLAVLIACFVTRNHAGKYAVKEKEEVRIDLESHSVNEESSCEYSDNDEKPLRSSLYSLERYVKGDSSSLDSSVEEGCRFNEDGSFIGEYTSHKQRASM